MDIIASAVQPIVNQYANKDFESEFTFDSGEYCGIANSKTEKKTNELCAKIRALYEE